MMRDLCEMLQTLEQKGTRLTEEYLPALSCYSVRHIIAAQGQLIYLSKVRPKGLTVDRPLRIAMETVAAYMMRYVEILAEKDPDKARLIAQTVKIPIVRKLAGPKNGRDVVEGKLLIDAIRDKYSSLGEEVQKNIASMLEKAT